ncbi:MAG TPA: Hpt domain-containing protein [Candidatus Cybelea sp.]|nr:Hpt domain-containing protein [Candidatus Cybelea sp.]
MAIDRRLIDQMRSDVGDAAFLRLAGLFEEETRASVIALRRLFDAQDWRELGRQAHSLKHACASFGLTDLAEAAATIETAGDAASSEGVERNLVALEAEMGGALEAFAAICRSVNGGQAR